MNAPAAPSPAPDDRAAETARALAMLDRLAEVGMQIVEAIAQRVQDPELPTADLTRASIDFGRVSRAVRLTLLVQSKLTGQTASEPEAAGPYDDEPIPYEVYWTDGEPLTPSAQRAVTQRTVRDLAMEVGMDAEAADRLGAEGAERLERERDGYGDTVGYRFVFRKVLVEICEAMGLRPGDIEIDLPPPPTAAGGGVSDDGQRFGHHVNAEHREERRMEGARGYEDAYLSSA